MKRLFDIIFSLLILVSSIPVLFVTFLFLVFDLNNGPILFIQERIGQNRKTFKIYKFRTMALSKIIANSDFDAGDISRVTKLGSILRKAKLDELPQLINVLKGDMSIIGPRPEVQQWTEVYPEKWKIVHSVKPGITDNASIEFRNEEELLAQSEDPIKTYKDEILLRKLDLYIDYVNNQSFWGDIMIILKTIKVVILK